MKLFRLHDRLVLRLWLRVFLFCVAGFVVLFVLADFFERIDTFIDHHSPVWTVLRYYLFSLPEFVRLTLPVDVVLATLFTFGVMGRNNETIALLASGVSMVRITQPVVLAALLCVGVSALLAEKVVPECNAHVSRIKRVEIEQRPPIDDPVRTDFKYRGANGYFYYVRLLDTRSQHMTGVVLHQTRDGRVVERLDAATADWVRDHWEFHDGFRRTFQVERGPAADSARTSLSPRPGDKTEPFRVTRVPDLEETPEALARVEPDPNAMNYARLHRQIEMVRESGGNPNDYIVSMYTKLSYPWTSLVLALLGIGLSAQKKKASMASGFGLTLVICFSYLAIEQIGAALGKNERLSPLLAAWVGNLIYGAVAVALLTRVNR
jgi:lipopolysaccharide export system permease protein